MGDEKQDQSQPAGGYDKTTLTRTKGPRYTIRITFHSASNIPRSDIDTGYSDPFVLAQLNTELPPRHSDDPHLRFRSRTVHRNREPEWNAHWVVGGIPASGFELKTRLYDEDFNHDDRLGTLHFKSGRLDDNWQGPNKEEFKLKKSGADPAVYGLRWCAAIARSSKNLHARIVISIELLGRTEQDDCGKAFTLNNFWFVHYSPLVGRVAGTKAKDDTGVERSEFQANEMQLTGPVPNELYHRYVEFKTFIGGMFEGTGFRGRILNKALHHQHENIYVFNSRTRHGVLPDGPGKDMTLQFLRMAHFDQGGRIFTYIIGLNGLMRFTETGEEFGIDLLSKHSMHSDVNVYIAYSGEFLIRRLANPDLSPDADQQRTHPTDDVPGGPPSDSPPEDPKYYELVIDNDSGTYRPNADLLPVLKKFLERNLPGLQISTYACDDDELKQIKAEQKQAKEGEGEHMVYGQQSDTSSISSSDASDLEERAQSAAGGGGKKKKSTLEKGVSAMENPSATVKGAFKPDKHKHKHEPKKGKAGREEREEKADKAADNGKPAGPTPMVDEDTAGPQQAEKA